MKKENLDKHLQAILLSLESEESWKLHEWMHQNLCILDDKANALLAVSSLILAIITFLLTDFSHNISSSLVNILLIFLLILNLYSTFRLLTIFYVYWSTTDDFLNQEKMLNDLLKVRNNRSKIIRRTVVVVGSSFFAIFLIMIYYLYKVVW